MNDRDIIALYWARDEKAIEKTAEKYGRYCTEISMRILHNHADAEECVNDTWLRTWQSIPPHRPTALRAFIAKICRNLSIDRYRALHAGRCNRDLEVALEELEDCISLPEEDASFLPALLDQFLKSLDPLDRKLFMGRYWHAYSVNRLAAHYGMTPNAVSLRLSRIRDRLRKFLEESGYSV